MKKISLLLLGLVLIIGTSHVNATAIPDLSGTWVTTNGTSILFTGETYDLAAETDIWNLSQQDRIVTGMNSFYLGEELVEESLTGVISPDGKTVYIVDKNGGLYIGSLDQNNSMSISYLNTGEVRDKAGYGLALSMTMEKKTP
ncbi:MAG: hypothetical protein CVV33_07040 [Methanomicrobiales archaeon HGW-Methanomicrobiales-4]|nr:MAG: hypothetical protein CVV33_07040 [Methanomicrobiales archaeon HGW-Methanomicrobiales-4]